MQISVCVFFALVAGVYVLAHGCDSDLKDKLEKKCDTAYEEFSAVADDIPDEFERMEAQCCALETMEKCSLRAYDRTNCAAEKPKLKENLKAARLFLSVLSNVTCDKFRGQCSSASQSFTWTSWSVTVALAFVFLKNSML